MKKFILYLAPAVALFTAASCSSPSEDAKSTGTEYMPDMYRGPAYETYGINPVYGDSMSSRLPVNGTVARGNAVYTDLDRQMSHDYMVANYPGTPEGYEAAGSMLNMVYKLGYSLLGIVNRVSTSIGKPPLGSPKD